MASFERFDFFSQFLNLEQILTLLGGNEGRGGVLGGGTELLGVGSDFSLGYGFQVGL